MQKTSYLSYFQIQIKGGWRGKENAESKKQKTEKTQKEEKRKEVFLVKRKITLRA